MVLFDEDEDHAKKEQEQGEQEIE